MASVNERGNTMKASQIAQHAELKELADEFAYLVNMHYAERRESVGEVFTSTGFVSKMLDDEWDEADRYSGWTYRIGYSFRTECGDDDCRECSQDIASSIVIVPDYEDVYFYESRPGYHPVEVTSLYSA